MDLARQAIENLHWISWDRLAFYAAHFPVYWGTCLALFLLGLGKLTPEQEKKNLVSRRDVALRVLEVQTSQFFSYVGLDLLWLMPNPDGPISVRWLYVLVGLLLFDFVEYVMHRLYHHRLL
jgi:sterol desaturase/sphingolipid hydroxylase (fatty acid hydroxylase superfamily)